MSKYLFANNQYYITTETLAKINEFYYKYTFQTINLFDASQLLEKSVKIQPKTSNICFKLGYDEQQEQIIFAAFLDNYPNVWCSQCISPKRMFAVFISDETLLTPLLPEQQFLKEQLLQNALNEKILIDEITLRGVGIITCNERIANVFETLKIVMPNDEEIVFSIGRLVEKMDTSQLKRNLNVEFYPEVENFPMIKALNISDCSNRVSKNSLEYIVAATDSMFCARKKFHEIKFFESDDEYRNYWLEYMENQQPGKIVFNNMLL